MHMCGSDFCQDKLSSTKSTYRDNSSFKTDTNHGVQENTYKLQYVIIYNNVMSPLATVQHIEQNDRVQHTESNMRGKYSWLLTEYEFQDKYIVSYL